MKYNKITTAICLSLLGSTLSTSAFAADEQIGGLEVIEVTATKRVTTEREIPMAIEAFSGESIEKNNIVNLEQLTDKVPNIIIGESFQSTTVNIRGMGSGTDRSFEQSVAMFIDGVYMPRSRTYRSPFFDVQRAEILRGPQAVLFGLNATAGSVSIHSASTEPGDDAFVKLGGAYESEFSGARADLVAGTSIGDDLGVRIALRQNDTGDGQVYNAYTDEDEGSKEETLARLSLKWNASENLSFTGKVNYANSDADGQTGEHILTSEIPYAELMGVYQDSKFDWVRYNSDNSLKTLTDKPAGLEHELLTASLGFDWQAGDNTVSGTFAYAESDYTQVYTSGNLASNPNSMFGGANLLLSFSQPDLAAAFAPAVGQETADIIAATLLPVLPSQIAADNLAQIVDETYEQSSVELRIASPVDQEVSYVAGIYLEDSSLHNLNSSFSSALLGGWNAGLVNFMASGFTDLKPTYGVIANPSQEQDSFTISPFVNLTWNINDNLRVLTGVRYSSQEKEYSRSLGECSAFNSYDENGTYGDEYIIPDAQVPAITACGTLDNVSKERTAENFMPELTLQYDVDNTSIAFVKVGQSAKSGGFAFAGTVPSEDQLEYDDEIATNFEVGYKALMLDGDAELNIAAFHTQFDDLQVTSFVTQAGSSPQSFVSNAGEAETFGVELEFNIALTDWLTTGVSAAWLDTEYTKYSEGPCYPDDPSENELGTCDKSGLELPFSPEYSGSVYFDVFTPVADGLYLTAGADMSFSASYHTSGSLNPTTEQDDYTKFNARIGITNDENWSVSIIGQNLTEEAVLTGSTDFLGGIGYLSAPRTVTVQGSYTF